MKALVLVTVVLAGMALLFLFRTLVIYRGIMERIDELINELIDELEREGRQANKKIAKKLADIENRPRYVAPKRKP